MLSKIILLITKLHFVVVDEAKTSKTNPKIHEDTVLTCGIPLIKWQGVSYHSNPNYKGLKSEGGNFSRATMMALKAKAMRNEGNETPPG